MQCSAASWKTSCDPETRPRRSIRVDGHRKYHIPYSLVSLVLFNLMKVSKRTILKSVCILMPWEQSSVLRQNSNNEKKAAYKFVSCWLKSVCKNLQPLLCQELLSSTFNSWYQVQLALIELSVTCPEHSSCAKSGNALSPVPSALVLTQAEIGQWRQRRRILRRSRIARELRKLFGVRQTGLVADLPHQQTKTCSVTPATTKKFLIPLYCPHF